MVTRAEGAVIRMTYDKYRSRRKVEPRDLDMLDRLAEAARIQLSYETDGIYAQVAVYSDHFSHVSVMRKVLLRMTSWMHYLYLDH